MCGKTHQEGRVWHVWANGNAAAGGGDCEGLPVPSQTACTLDQFISDLNVPKNHPENTDKTQVLLIQWYVVAPEILHF